MSKAPTRRVEWAGQVYNLPIPTKGRKTSDKDMLQIASLILEMYSSGEYTMASCCAECGIDQSTLHAWRGKNPKIQKLYDMATAKADQQYSQLVNRAAKDTILKVIKGEFVRKVRKREQVIEMQGQTPVIVGQRITETEQWMKPSTSLLLGMLELTEPENYSRQLKLAEMLQGASSDNLEAIFAEYKIVDVLPDKPIPLLPTEEAAREYGRKLERPKKKD